MANLRIEIPSAGTQVVEIVVGKKLHELTVDLDALEDGGALHTTLALIEDLRKMKEEAEANGDDFTKFVALTEGMADMHPRVMESVDALFGAGTYKTIFGDRQPIFRGVMLLVGIEPLVSRAYESIFAAYMPQD